MPTDVMDCAVGATTGELAPKRIYFLGGLDGSNYAHRQNDVYDPEEDVWSIGTPMPTPRFGLGATVVNDEIFAIGGKTGDTYLAVNEKYTPIGYIPEFPSWLLPIFLVATLFVLVFKKRTHCQVKATDNFQKCSHGEVLSCGCGLLKFKVRVSI